MGSGLKGDLEAELRRFDFGISARPGHNTYEAASGPHDDLVMALCLAVCWAERPSPSEVSYEATRRRLAATATAGSP